MRPSCFAFVLLASLPHLAIADPKSELQAEYDVLSAAFAKRDPAPFETALAPDYVLHIGKRTRTRASVVADFRKQMANMSDVKWVRKVTNVSGSKGVFVATVKSVFDGDFAMGAKKSHFWNSAVSKDTWIQGPSKHWKLKSSSLTSLDAKVDGKPAGHFPE
jgi:hypothetical protein